jgi:hypothetical protein
MFLVHFIRSFGIVVLVKCALVTDGLWSAVRHPFLPYAGQESFNVRKQVSLAIEVGQRDKSDYLM